MAPSNPGDGSTYKGLPHVKTGKRGGRSFAWRHLSRMASRSFSSHSRSTGNAPAAEQVATVTSMVDAIWTRRRSATSGA